MNPIVKRQTPKATFYTATAMIYPHVLTRSGLGIRGSLDDRIGPNRYLNIQLDEKVSSISR